MGCRASPDVLIAIMLKKRKMCIPFSDERDVEDLAEHTLRGGKKSRYPMKKMGTR